MPVIWKRWLQLLFALLFVALGGWMLLDALAAPAGAKTAQIWSALAIVVMFAGCAAIFAYELVGSRRADGRARGDAGHGAAPAAGPLVAVYSNLWTTLGLAGCVSFAAAGVMMLLASIAGGSDGIGWPGFIVGPLTAIVFGGFAVSAPRNCDAGGGRSDISASTPPASTIRGSDRPSNGATSSPSPAGPSTASA